MLLATDAAQNVSEFQQQQYQPQIWYGCSSYFNTAPSGFKVDGDISEWKSSGITHFMMGVSENSYNPSKGVGGAGTFDDANDTGGKLYIAIDADAIHGANVTDDVFNAGSGNWWEQDAFKCFRSL